jgi:acyl-CoA reductase-like NAD-dependent aldehyde dehydrogenase
MTIHLKPFKREDFESRNPATGALIETYPGQDAAEVEARLERAFATWRRWSQAPIAERAAVLTRMGELLEERVEEYAQLITSEMGKPIGEARGEVKKAAGGCKHFGGAGQAYLQAQPIDGLPNAHVVYQSIGPIFAVMPWNLPFWQVLRFFAPTALVGNTVLVKHAETVQGSALALEKLVRDAGGPEGLYANIVVGRDVAASIIADPRVRAVTLTGSVAAGRSVAQTAGLYGKKVVLELGGSDPFVVLEDADLDRAAQLGVTSRFSNNAQSCIAAKRFILAAPIADAFTKAFVEKAAALKVGDPMSAETQLGPLARADLRDTVHRQVQAAVAAGAKILTGGKPLDGPGNYYAPTVLTGLPPDAPIAQEEFFGPVAMLFTVKDEEEAIALANATEFGLGAAVWSRDADRAARVAGRIEAGCVFINDFVRSDARAPFGGVKGSGFGRELGELGARELANAKLIFVG